jgi:hypothetical protein
VDEIVASSTSEEERQARIELQEKIMAATEASLVKLMHEGKWALISEWKYRMPHLLPSLCPGSFLLEDIPNGISLPTDKSPQVRESKPLINS